MGANNIPSGCKVCILLGIMFISVMSFSQSRKQILYEAGFCNLEFYFADSLSDISDDADSIIGVQSCVAYGDFIKARKVNNWQKTIFTTGAILTVYPLLFYVISQDKKVVQSQWPVMAVGGTLIVVSVPLTKRVKRYAKAAVDDYNAWANHTYVPEKKIYLGSSGNLFGVGLKF